MCIHIYTEYTFFQIAQHQKLKEKPTNSHDVFQPFPIERFGNKHPIEPLPFENGWQSQVPGESLSKASPESEGLEGKMN